MSTLHNENTISQCDLILAHLINGQSITHRQAQILFNCDRLGARIHDLRKSGHKIETTTIKTGNRKSYAQYSMRFN